ncbi:hypothetical protein KP509_35G005500 [Ceratopteris richardii]|uniref:Uncharacterized protein n=1 Tax=Ceratopteris richardii TaxID=49495 RepID=A0A8T2QEF1_CERRI|nr:hypothetical protein KP509_35G005500 [Ceratopteris richardii]
MESRLALSCSSLSQCVMQTVAMPRASVIAMLASCHNAYLHDAQCFSCRDVQCFNRRDACQLSRCLVLQPSRCSPSLRPSRCSPSLRQSQCPTVTVLMLTVAMPNSPADGDDRDYHNGS